MQSSEFFFKDLPVKETMGDYRKYSRDHLSLGNGHFYTVENDLVNKSIQQLGDGTEKDPITKLRLLCMSRGAAGIVGLGRAFRVMDDDGEKSLNEEEFIRGIKEYGLDLTDHEIQEMFKRFDEDGMGSINMTEFLLKVRPPLHQCRLDIIDQAFNKMDKTLDGVITLEDLKHVYNVDHHPWYVNGDRTKEDIVSEFVNKFEGGSGKLVGKVTKEEFRNYYATISASIDNDTFFDLVMRQAYKL